MQQYFIDSILDLEQRVQFNAEQSHHIMRVVRMKKDDVVRVSDANHNLFSVRLDMDSKQAYGIVEARIHDDTKSRVEITLVQGMIKGEKWDYLLQKASELGVCKIVPLISSRCVVKIQDEKLDKKLQRWNKITLEACEQCKRSTPVIVREPISMKDVKNVMSDLNLIAYENTDAIHDKLYRVLEKYPSCKSITCVIGSEGGFSEDEVKDLLNVGFLKISLGTRILRAETAALSIINNIDFFYDMIGDKHGEN